jgi:hypothetical protein
LSEIRIIGPDGQRFVFPAGTDPEVMKSAMRRRYTGETRRTTEMIRNTQLPDERMQGARDYLARDQLRQDMEAGRQARRTEEATGPENVAQERFYTGAQGRTLGAAPLIQGAINIPISAMMYPFLTEEQKAGRSFDEFVSDMSSAGYDQARGSIDRAREKRPLESLGLEIAGGFIAGKTAYDDLGNRFLASQPGARGALVGAGSGAQYEFLESEGDPLAAGRGALIGAPVGAGVSKAMEAAAKPLGQLFRGEVPVPKIGPDATNTIVGGTLGGIAPAETAEERAQNIALGAGLGAAARTGSKMLDDLTSTGAPRAMPDTMPAGAGDNPYFGRQSLRPPGSGPSAREIETQQQWATATPIVTQARTTAQSAQQAADAALQSKAPADIARAKDQKKALVGQIKEAQASRAGMDTPEDARLAETLASLTENTSDPVLLSTQISAAKTSLDRLLTDIGSPVEGNLIPVKTNILTRTQAPRSAAEGPQDRASVTRYAEGEAPPVKGMGFGAGGPKVNPETLRLAKSEGFDTSRVLYRGMREPLSPDGLYATTTPGYETQGLGVSLSTSAKAAAEYGENVYPVVVRGKFFSEKEYVNRINKLYETQGIGPRDAAVRVRAQLAAEGYAGLKADGGKLLDKGELRVWGDDSGLVPNVKVVNDASGSRTVGKVLGVKGMGFGAETPKTPQQAVRFETPGSPEWEAAKAKGLDMSQAGRMARARKQGFNTNRVLYHGTNRDFESFDVSKSLDGLGVHMGTIDQAETLIDNSIPGLSNKRQIFYEGAKVLPLYVRANKSIRLPDMENWEPHKVARVLRRKGIKVKASGLNGNVLPSDIVKALKDKGYDSIVYKNRFEGRDAVKGKGADSLIVFDPSNIRSVNAAFDPEKSGSSTLLAAAPFAAVGGVGAGTAMGEDD